jgi:ssDNA-binding Zn-finger/Zn-ribbon topoisomerase 1
MEGGIKMRSEKEKEICPTCGQTMELLKTHKHSQKVTDTNVDEDRNVESFDISEIWHCLNCSEEWQTDIKRNIWRKNELTE